MTRYSEAIAYIDGIVKFTSKNSLSHTRKCLALLGSPDRDFRSIHVAGTNGKGSVCAFLSRILTEAGIRNALFTSPHLISVRERFRIDGEMISEADFLSAFEKVRAVSARMEADGEAHPTYFEFLFLMGAVYFSAKKVPVCVLETGLGGRLDATSAVTDPYVCVITKIGLDHMQYLGNTKAEIAAEKAGILSDGVPVVYDAQGEEASDVIAKAAASRHARAFPLTGAMYKILRNTHRSIDFSMSGRYDESTVFTVSFPAPYQAGNAALSVLTADVLKKTYPDVFGGLTEAVISAGISGTVWEGRMEEILPDVFADGAHNEDGIEALIRAAGAVCGGRKASLLFAAVSDKDYTRMIRMLAGAIPFSCVTVTSVAGKRKTDAEELACIFRRAGCTEVKAVPSVREAFRTALADKGDGLLFITGSLYLVGAVKSLLLEGEKHDQL